MCEQLRMDKPSYKALAEAAGISKGYACDILGDKQPPSRPLAIHIFRKTGWRHSTIEALTPEQIEVLEQIEPWRPRAAA